MTKQKKRFMANETIWAIVFLLPSLIGLIVFVVYPLFRSLYLSMTDWDFVHKANFIGLQNYIDMFSDRKFIRVFNNTLFFVVITVPVLVILPMILATMMNQKIRGIRFFRAVYFIPVIASALAVGLIWQWLFNGEFGMVNYVLKLIGIKGPDWLTDKKYAIRAVIFVHIWKSLGYNMMLFLAGLQGIPREYYEVAELEKITIWKKFRYITVPLLKPTTVFVATTTMIGAFQVFDQVVVMTGGGPAQHSSVLAHYIYQNAFQYYNMGYACALGWVLAAIIFVLQRAMHHIEGSDD